MKVQIKKNIIPEEISAAGGASLVIVNKDTVDLETSIDEAKDALCVVGDKLLIKGEFVGLFKSMVKGIERDGNARTLGDFLTLYPVPTGEFDLDKGWNPAVNGVRIRARVLNEMEIDISNWELEDVTPGRRSFTLESVQGGGVQGVVKPGEATGINGRNLPLTADVRVEWRVVDTAKSGTVPASKVTSTATRLDIAADALAELDDAAYEGKRIEFTVRGNFANAKIAATIALSENARFTGTNPSGNIQLSLDGTFDIVGKCLPTLTEEVLSASELLFTADTYKVGDNPYTRNLATATDVDIAASTATKIVVKKSGFYGDLSPEPSGTLIAGTITATFDGKPTSVHCVLKV